jgi:hypothetical protein
MIELLKNRKNELRMGVLKIVVFNLFLLNHTTLKSYLRHSNESVDLFTVRRTKKIDSLFLVSKGATHPNTKICG